MHEGRGTIETAPGVTIHYETRGRPSDSQPSLILHHYYGGSPSTFDTLLSQPELASAHAVVYHARGWAPSSGPSDPDAYGVAHLSRDLAAVIDTTGLAHDSQAGFVVIGHSMGAKVAQHYAATTGLSTSALKGLVLVAPAPLRALEFPPEAKAQQQAAYQSDESVRFAVRNVLTARPGTLDEKTTEQCVRDSRRGNAAATAAWPSYGAAEDYSGLENKIAVAVVVLRGDLDFERDLVGELGTEGKGWTNKTVEGCGHLIPLERPACLAGEIRLFLGGLL